jgi:hypothetical protein
VSKIGESHAMAGVECPVCLDTPCEVVRLLWIAHVAHVTADPWLLDVCMSTVPPSFACCADRVRGPWLGAVSLRRELHLLQVLPCNHGCCHICLDKLITRGVRLPMKCRAHAPIEPAIPMQTMAPEPISCASSS